MTNQSKLTVVLIGAGGHAAVVESAIIKGDEYFVFEILDDEKPPGTRVVRGKVLGGRKFLQSAYDGGVRFAHVAIGDNTTREAITQELEHIGFASATVRHPQAIIEEGVVIGHGAFLAAASVIGARANIGRGCIINTAASVDHDCIIGDFAHVCPGARLAGDVHVGARTMIGTNATIIPGIRIGADVVIGAGAVVIRNVADGRTVAGNPARVVESRRES
jgi:sugar O-acyltransferase (sialic acid O-acetyltransferase NeuD family)